MDPSSTATIDSGDTAWVMMCTALIFLMTPALGLFYAGLAQAKNALSLMYLTMLSVAVVTFQWYLIGYSLTFSPTAGPFIGDSTHFLLRGVGVAPEYEFHTIPAMVFMIFQAMFACLTPALAFGAAAERMSLGPSIIFIFIWTTVVYDVVTCWIWNPNGWLYKLGAMDYAGGATVHASSGLAAVAYSMLIGKRRLQEDAHPHTPHNVSFMYIGMAFLWFGWFAFNAGSGLAANARAANSFVASHLGGCVGGIVWLLIDWWYTRKWSVVGLLTGVIAGLATITPGSGYVSPSSSLLFGLLGGIACNYAVRYKHKYGFDDALDVFTVHYIGGIVGLVLTGIFAERYIIGLGAPAGTPLEQVQIGGWLDGHWVQVPVQLAMIVTVSGWSFVVTYIMLIIINRIPSMRLRLASKDEVIGTDWAQMGERAYGYIEWEEAMRRVNSHMTSTSTQYTHNTDHKWDPILRQIRRVLGAGERSTTVGGAPNLQEEAVLDYGQQKDLGSVPLSKIIDRPPCFEQPMVLEVPAIAESSGTGSNSNSNDGRGVIGCNSSSSSTPMSEAATTTTTTTQSCPPLSSSSAKPRADESPTVAQSTCHDYTEGSSRSAHHTAAVNLTDDEDAIVDAPRGDTKQKNRV